MKENIRNTILGLFRQKELMKELEEEDDFFDLGVSSLTIVELQISIENSLNLTVPTSTLMSLATVKDWIEAYTKQAQ